MTVVTVELGGVTFANARRPGADGVAYVFERLSPWYGGAGVRLARTERPTSHGEFAERGLRTGKALVLEGWAVCPSRAAAAAATERLAALLADGEQVEMTVVDPDVGSRMSVVQLAAEPVVEWSPRSREVFFHFPLLAADPLRYGDLVSVQTGFPELVGGLVYPLYEDEDGNDVGWLDYGPPSTSGVVALENPGTATSYPQFEVTGPAPGFEVVRVGTGERLVFDGAVPAGSVFVIDTASGVALMDGVSDRTLTWQDPMGVGPGESAEFAFVPRGEVTAAVLRASLRPAYW